MTQWLSFWRWLQTACRAVVAWLMLQSAAWAQAPGGLPKPDANKGESYVVSYMLVLLGIGLGMLILCRSSRRRDRARPEQYEEGKIAGHDDD